MHQSTAVRCLYFLGLRLLVLGDVAVGFASIKVLGHFSPTERTLQERKNSLQVSLFNGFGFDWKPKENAKVNEIGLLEEDVVASAQAKVDKERISRALSDDPVSRATPQWAAAVAASLAAGIASIFVLQNLTVGAMVAVAVGFVASRDPIEEEDSAGAIARTVGRYTIASVGAAAPKAKAIARAALTGEEEVAELKCRLKEIESRSLILEDENAGLKLWKERRIWVDDVLSTYNLQQLKEEARASGLQVGGTKAQLLMRLVEAGVIKPEFE